MRMVYKGKNSLTFSSDSLLINLRQVCTTLFNNVVIDVYTQYRWYPTESKPKQNPGFTFGVYSGFRVDPE